MIKHYYMHFKNHMQILKMLTCHLLYKFGFRNTALIILSIVFCLFIIFPLYLFSEISGYNIQIIETVTYYLLVVLWIICMIITFRSNILKKIENNLNYCYNLLNLLNESYFIFIDKYEKYINLKKHMYKETNIHELSKYDNYIINITFIEIFKLYFLNMNNSIKNKQFSYVNTKFLTQLENEDNLEDFYGKVLFNYNNDVNGVQKINKTYIYIMDKVMYKLINKSWFPKYFKYADIYGLIQYIVQTWINNTIEYSKFSIEEEKEITKEINLQAT